MTLEEEDPEARLELREEPSVFGIGNIDRDPGEDALESDLRLRPALNRHARADTSEVVSSRKNAAKHLPTSEAAFGIVGEDSSGSLEISDSQRQASAAARYNQSGGLYPAERHYPTLEAMQRLYKLFGYVAVLLVFPYLLFRFVYLVWTTDDGLLQELALFSEFAVPVLFATVALTGTLFAAAEGLRLAMDIQDNLLRIANRGGRLKD